MKSVRIPSKVAKDTLSILKRFDNSVLEEIDTCEVVTLIGKFQDALKERRTAWVLKKPARERRKAKKAERQDEWAQIREKVLARAATVCEVCGGCSALAELECDHMFGGSNRKTLESFFTVWAICRNCHRLKTHNQPDAGYWLIRFVEHCAREAGKYGDMAEDESNGYAHAADIAKDRLGSLQIQGRAK